MRSLLLSPESRIRNFFLKYTDKILSREATAPMASVPMSSTQLPPHPAPSFNADEALEPVPALTPAAASAYALNHPTHEDVPNRCLNANVAQTLSPSFASIIAPDASETNSTPTFARVYTSNTSSGIESAPESALVHPPSQNSKYPAPGGWVALEGSLRVLHQCAGIFPPVQSAIGSFIACLDIMQQLSDKYDEREELAAELTHLSDAMAQHFAQSASPRMSDAVARFSQGLEEQLKILRSGQEVGAEWRLLEANTREERLRRYCRRISSLFRQLQVDASLSIWSIVNDQIADSRLDRLAPVHLAKYDSALSTSINRRTCTANTRINILSELDNWSRDSSHADIYWMNGMAGTGKTTIACSFSESLGRRKQLAATFFCTRTTAECRAATRIIPTIAYQLARYSMPFRSALCESLQTDPDATSANLKKQFDQLLKVPLFKVKEAVPSGLVVVVDALDECDSMHEVELLLSILLKNVTDVPIKFFLTSRPEPEIYDRMKPHIQGRRTLHLHEVEKSLVQADIQLYLQVELASLSPTPAQIQELTLRSGVLFIYAATLVRYIQSLGPRADPQSRLESVLSMGSRGIKQHAEIDELYTVILETALNNDNMEDRESENMRQVLWTVLCLQEPVPARVLAELAGLSSERRVHLAIQPMRAVLNFSETSGLVSTLHASFPDFMFDRTRSKIYFCDSAFYNTQLAQRCFQVMESQLKFNICGLESSFVPDAMVDDLDDRLIHTISPELWYACRYWVDHLSQAGYSDSICAMIDNFLLNQLLFWMEVLNLKRKIGMGVEILTKVKPWFRAGNGSKDISRRIEDCREFVTSFAANRISESTPHIYISGLPFCPKSSFVFRQYYRKSVGLINVVGSAVEGMTRKMLTSWEAESAVFSIAYSPDGNRVAYGCSAGTVVIRNALNGTIVAGPLEGHVGWVNSVAYSPDGIRIASGSSDKTIRVWDATNGILITSPLAGHAGWVSSVAYSPDSTRIVSGSWDCTIRVWNATSGAPVAGPLEGHAGLVLSVTYSPDGTRILSSSSDKTIRVWSATDGTLVVGPLEGHTRSVRSISFSSDGIHLVSGSHDKTIRVWNFSNGTLVVGPLVGHTSSVNSVAYSPDGTRIVSGSSDKTIRVWDSTSGKLVAGPLRARAGPVYSVAYSPDGTRIVSASEDKAIQVWYPTDGMSVSSTFMQHAGWVKSAAYSPKGTHIASGSNDKTIRVWDATNGKLIAGPLKGHTSSVQSVAYSPDGTRIVSGSWDHTIRVWGATDGTLILGPLEGHTRSVNSVAYSPDGAHIVSGSSDKSIRVWDATDSALVVGIYKGHVGPVFSAAYSPDGARIVSGSQDSTIRIWDATNGTLVIDPINGHTQSVWSVTYSPDGTRIASGSHDKTIRVWNADDGTLIAGPFEGHAGSIKSVAYSPEGTRIVSGSWDKTIRVWDATNGTLVASTLEGHTGSVLSVAYSPNGAHIVSSGQDETIRVWSATDGALKSNSLEPNSRSIVPTGSSSDSGWVTTPDLSLLFWIPHELRFVPMSVSLLQSELFIGPTGSLACDYSNAVLGEHWVGCFST